MCEGSYHKLILHKICQFFCSAVHAGPEQHDTRPNYPVQWASAKRMFTKFNLYVGSAEREIVFCRNTSDHPLLHLPCVIFCRLLIKESTTMANLPQIAMSSCDELETCTTD